MKITNKLTLLTTCCYFACTELVSFFYLHPTIITLTLNFMLFLGNKACLIAVRPCWLVPIRLNSCPRLLTLRLTLKRNARGNVRWPIGATAKNKDLTARTKTSRREQKPHGKNKKLTAKNKKLTTKKTSRRKQKPHGGSCNFMRKLKTRGGRWK